jgi:phosphoribosylglycinamide formyltransferase-1
MTTSSETLRVAFFVSGNGSTFEHLAEKMISEFIPAVPALVVSSSPKAYALLRAERLGIPSSVIARKNFASPAEHAQALLQALHEHHCNFIALAGYLEWIPPEVVREFRHRMLNIHPALLPAFGGKGMYGMNVHKAVIEYGARLSGATVHFVDEEYDHGPILAQQAVLVSPNDTPEMLAERVHEIELHLYANAIRLVAQSRVRVQNRKVVILPTPDHDTDSPRPA